MPDDLAPEQPRPKLSQAPGLASRATATDASEKKIWPKKFTLKPSFIQQQVE